MAVDTDRKRAAALGFGGDELIAVPDAELDASDRFAFLGLYAPMEEYDPGPITNAEGGFHQGSHKQLTGMGF